MSLRLLAITVIAVAAATTNHITNTNLLVASQTPPTELAYGGIVELVDPGEIVAVNGILVHASIATSVQRLLANAQTDGIPLSGWGWRSHQRQHELRRINGCRDGWVHREDETLSDFSPSSGCRIPTARPGASMHETGLAIDFTCGGRPMARSRCFYWLLRNAARYGLYNLPSEPWHWSVNGR
ncbi:MAG: M15 family metallopeptidase [Acidimicrobiia bacterium]|nr:M15 family metallopeptidase [Acidimicrobiia bacterium]